MSHADKGDIPKRCRCCTARMSVEAPVSPVKAGQACCERGLAPVTADCGEALVVSYGTPAVLLVDRCSVTEGECPSVARCTACKAGSHTSQIHVVHVDDGVVNITPCSHY